MPEITLNVASMELGQQLKEVVNIVDRYGDFDAADQVIVENHEIIIRPVFRSSRVEQSGVLESEADFKGWSLTPNPAIEEGHIVVRSDGSRLAITKEDTTLTVQRFEFREDEVQ